MGGEWSTITLPDNLRYSNVADIDMCVHHFGQRLRRAITFANNSRLLLCARERTPRGEANAMKYIFRHWQMHQCAVCSSTHL